MNYLKNHCNYYSYCFLVAICLLLQLSSNGQSTPTDAYISMHNSTSPGMVTGNYYVEVEDPDDVSQIEIKLGISWGGGEYVNEVLNYDVTSGLPPGFSYSRVGKLISIRIGEYSENPAYYGEVRVKNGSGIWSSIYQFVSN